MKNTYEVIPYRVWQHPDGRRASIHGANPESGFVLVMAGWTVTNLKTGTSGIGRKPWGYREDADKWCDKENARLHAIAVANSIASERNKPHY